MDNSTDFSYAKYITDLRLGFQLSQVLFVTVELGLYDLLDNVEMTALEISCKKNTDLDATERLLDYAAGLKLIKKDTKEESAIYSNIPEAAHYLLTSKPSSMAGIIAHSSRSQYPLFQHLMTTIRDGNNTKAYENAFGIDMTQGKYKSLYNSSGYSDTFIQFMHQVTLSTSQTAVKAFDLSSYRNMCDLGGGSGALAYTLASAYPESSVTVFDLAPAVASAQKIRPDNTKHLDVKFVVGNYFKDDFPPADLYIFSRVLHDWKDDTVHQLLQKTFNSLKSGGAVMVIQSLLNATKTGSLYALRANIDILVEANGKERSEKEFRHLLEKSGFVDIKCYNIRTMDVGVILATKP